MVAWKFLTAGALVLATTMAPVQAAPAGGFAPAAFVASGVNGSDVVQVRRSRGHWHRHRRGRNIGVGIGIGVLGAIIASEAYRSSPYYYDGGDPRGACAQEYRSFEWNTGMYTTFGGERRLCPYLR